MRKKDEEREDEEAEQKEGQEKEDEETEQKEDEEKEAEEKENEEDEEKSQKPPPHLAQRQHRYLRMVAAAHTELWRRVKVSMPEMTATPRPSSDTCISYMYNTATDDVRLNGLRCWGDIIGTNN